METQKTPPRQSVGRQSGTARRTALIAMESSTARDSVASELIREGYRVIHVADGVELLEQFESAFVLDEPPHPIDLLISDVKLPGMTGTAVVEVLRKAGWHTPTILIAPSDEWIPDAVVEKLGATLVVTRPLRLDDLRLLTDDITDRSLTTPPSRKCNPKRRLDAAVQK